MTPMKRRCRRASNPVGPRPNCPGGVPRLRHHAPDGRLQAGFQGAGHYSDPACVGPCCMPRVRAILGAVPFNSWFLDVYATGMAFDNHAPHRRNAAGALRRRKRSQPVLDKQHAASADRFEGGHAAADGILFAHGMQTPVIG